MSSQAYSNMMEEGNTTIIFHVCIILVLCELEKVQIHATNECIYVVIGWDMVMNELLEEEKTFPTFRFFLHGRSNGWSKLDYENMSILLNFFNV